MPPGLFRLPVSASALLGGALGKALGSRKSGIPQEVGEGKGIETLGWGLEAAWW